jgi:hypothetical protein
MNASSETKRWDQANNASAISTAGKSQRSRRPPE